MHLKPEELIDVAEGAAADAAFPHLASCAACRTEVAELRAALGSVEGLGSVPEPPPFFFDRFQHRVAAAVAAEADRGWISRVIVPLTALGAVAVLAIVVNVGHRRSTPAVLHTPAA